MLGYDMNLKSLFCISLIFLIVEAYDKSHVSNVMGYNNYRQYVNQMYHQQDRFPQMPIYGQSFDNHGSYKFNPHVIPNCKNIDQFICCQTKYTYECHTQEPNENPPTTTTEDVTTSSNSEITSTSVTASVSTEEIRTSTTSIITTMQHESPSNNNQPPSEV